MFLLFGKLSLEISRMVHKWWSINSSLLLKVNGTGKAELSCCFLTDMRVWGRSTPVQDWNVSFSYAPNSIWQWSTAQNRPISSMLSEDSWRGNSEFHSLWCLQNHYCGIPNAFPTSQKSTKVSLKSWSTISRPWHPQRLRSYCSVQGRCIMIFWPRKKLISAKTLPSWELSNYIHFLLQKWMKWLRNMRMRNTYGFRKNHPTWVPGLIWGAVTGL